MGKNILTKELLLKSVEEWNKARRAYPDLKPDLSGTNLSGAYLNGANLGKANLSGADLSVSSLLGANLSKANLSNAILREAALVNADLSLAKLSDANISRADLREANLSWTNFSRTNLSGANLDDANLTYANLKEASLREANLSGANLSWATLSGTDLSNADLRDSKLTSSSFKNVNLTGAIVGYTTFGGVDLNSAIGLDTLQHKNPSTIGIDTIYKSKGNIPEVFLRGCGVHDNFIEYVRSLTAKPFDYYSCFISHSTADKVFADRLYADLQAKGVRCWYAPHDMEGGEHVETQIDRAIKIHEKVLLVLSESSINSNWVKREITKAVKREEAEGKRVLFPISLVEFSTLEAWEFVDSKGRDLSEEIRKFYIPSFKGWENDNSLYTTEFDKLLKAFKDKSKQ
jgi:uncharacterized protein YjbI with pentapeptide repeats